MEAAGDLNHLNMLLKARSLGHGKWTEKILVQARKTPCEVGVNDLKDPTDKQITALYANLTFRSQKLFLHGSVFEAWFFAKPLCNVNALVLKLVKPFFQL